MRAAAVVANEAQETLSGREDPRTPEHAGKHSEGVPLF